ncbi:hypothetical protein [Streptomyces apocyni]|uniref:hypothetical protein n=1 Tax=Streptomyces apocyni TaxID=2654677 RepID=UPI0012E9E3FF|nr:hypothetical protein [Streptomyces apocyni]
MAVEVVMTVLADRQRADLRGPKRRKFERFLDDLAARGCTALGYRLAGDGLLEHLCVKHIHSSLRAVVAFESHSRAWVLLIGPHDQDPDLNVYTALYRLAGIETPPVEARTKPPCCSSDDGSAPVSESAEVDDLVTRAKALRRRR